MGFLYSVLLADPPWPFRVWSEDTGHGRSAESHYPTMTIEEMCALPVKELAEENAALFLWAVWPSIFEYVPPLLEAWGFSYRTLAFDWVKLNRRGIGLHVGMGYYTRGNPEPCLLAIKGKMPVAVHDERNVILTDEDTKRVIDPRTFRPIGAQGLPLFDTPIGAPLLACIGEHSEKPVIQYDKIERLYPDFRYLELFARKKRRGWASWGNEIVSDLEM